MPTSLVLTVLGEDRPGLVESLASIIAAHDGNWLESRMAQLAGQFAGILRTSVPDTNAAALINALQGLTSRGLQFVVVRSSTDEPAQNSRWLTLDLVGNDHLGIIRDLARTLAQRGINIEELQTACTSAPMTGGMLFNSMALRVCLGPADDLSYATVFRAVMAGHGINLATFGSVGEITKYTLLSERVPGAQVAEQIRAASGEIDFSHADVSVEGEVERLVAEAIDRHGRIDVAVNNAGTESTAELAAGTEAGQFRVPPVLGEAP